MYLFWHLFAIVFTRTSLFFHLLMFQCPGVFWSGVLHFIPSLLQLFVLCGQEVYQLSELYLASCSLPWQLPSFGLKISFKKVIGSSSYFSITTSSRVLLLIFMQFLSSSFLAEVSFQKNFHRRGLGGYLSSITVYEAMWNCFKKL